MWTEFDVTVTHDVLQTCTSCQETFRLRLQGWYLLSAANVLPAVL